MSNGNQDPGPSTQLTPEYLDSLRERAGLSTEYLDSLRNVASKGAEVTDNTSLRDVAGRFLFGEGGFPESIPEGIRDVIASGLNITPFGSASELPSTGEIVESTQEGGIAGAALPIALGGFEIATASPIGKAAGATTRGARTFGRQLRAPVEGEQLISNIPRRPQGKGFEAFKEAFEEAGGGQNVPLKEIGEIFDKETAAKIASERAGQEAFDKLAKQGIRTWTKNLDPKNPSELGREIGKLGPEQVEIVRGGMAEGLAENILKAGKLSKTQRDNLLSESGRAQLDFIFEGAPPKMLDDFITAVERGRYQEAKKWLGIGIITGIGTAGSYPVARFIFSLFE